MINSLLRRLRDTLFFLALLFYGLSYASTSITESTMSFYDISRQRLVPVEIYVTSSSQVHNSKTKLPVVIINHGYTVKNTKYSFLAKALACGGYFVISIQHDLKDDPALARTGNLFQQRKPVWEQGVKNILFIINKLSESKQYDSIDLSKLTLIGHSNGGDISMMFTEKYPELVEKVVSLDSLRYPFPIKNHIPILSLRANDTQADDGVLPKTGATIILLKNAKHIELSDLGSFKIKQQIIDLVFKFMDGK